MRKIIALAGILVIVLALYALSTGQLHDPIVLFPTVTVMNETPNPTTTSAPAESEIVAVWRDMGLNGVVTICGNLTAESAHLAEVPEMLTITSAKCPEVNIIGGVVRVILVFNGDLYDIQNLDIAVECSACSVTPDPPVSDVEKKQFHITLNIVTVFAGQAQFINVLPEGVRHSPPSVPALQPSFAELLLARKGVASQ